MMASGVWGGPCVEGHSAYIYDRGGITRLGQLLDISRIQWTRDRDGISEATLTLQGAACSNQRSLIAKIASKRHELVIFRGDTRVWEGPIFRVGDEGDRVVIAAKDVLAYLFGTPMSKDWDNSYNGGGVSTVTGRFEEIITYELTTNRTGRAMGQPAALISAWENLSPPANILPYLTVHHFPNEARTSANTMAFEMTVGEHLAGMARTSGIDFTAVGRAIHIWDVSRSLGQTRTMTEADFYGNVIVTEYGSDHTQMAYVVGIDGVFGEALNVDGLSFYGPWGTVYTAYHEEGAEAPVQSELNSQAARNVSGRSPAPVEVRIPDNSTIRLSAGLTISDLVPGVQIPLVATLNARARSQLQKLDRLVVTETAEAGELIQVTLTPATKPDSDEEEED